MKQHCSQVSIIQTDKIVYPSKSYYFRPNEPFPETPYSETAPETNYVYPAVREALHLLGLDPKNYGTENWNPLSGLIQPGNNVLIKPNLVMDVNGVPSQGNECLYTQPSVVAAVIDYVVLALKGQGKIVIGDAPMQDCNFERLISESGYDHLVQYYQNKGIDIQLVDFRELTSVVINGVRHSKINSNATGRIIDLGTESAFFGTSENEYRRMRVTNYDPTIMPQHHNLNKNEYYISDYVLNADVIINMPKPKSHRKAGATIALKNLVGMNVRKEFLPHHTVGSTSEGGDEYDQKSWVHRLRSRLYDKRNIWQAKGKYKQALLAGYCIRACSLTLKLAGNRYAEGSWYGNHTISKTIADLNKIAIYADKNGVLSEKPQRAMMIVADMIISGEKEGPVLPTAKPVGIIAAGTNPVCFDEAVATLMGFDIAKIPAIQETRNASGKYLLVEEGSKAFIVSNIPEFHQKLHHELPREKLLWFEPTSGWKNNIELR